MRSKRKFSLAVVIIIIVLAVFVIGIREEIKPREGISKSSLDLLSRQMSGLPDLNGRRSIGQGPVTIIAYLGNSRSSQEFIDQQYKHILKYVRTGNVTYVHKPAISFDDIESQNENFKKALSIYCESGEFWQRYEVQDYNATCPMPEEMYIDAFEVEKFGIHALPTLYIGINGRDNIVLSGIPTTDRLDRAIRNQYIKLGIG